MSIIKQLYPFKEKEFKKLLKVSFKEAIWLKVFLNDKHHGFTHGNQVRLACLKLIQKLTRAEKIQLLQAGKKISSNNFLKHAVIAIEIAAIFHDCGRFNDKGEVIDKEQRFHHILSAKRAKIFCDNLGLSIIAPAVTSAILSHDFQSQKLTPTLKSPKDIIGKIVQASDQMGWFHPDSINRTLLFNKALGTPFYNPKVSIKDRLKWTPMTKAGDALTVMLSQLFGPTGKDRFGVEFAQKKVQEYKAKLEKNIVKMATKHNLSNEVKLIIQDFKNRAIL